MSAETMRAAVKDAARRDCPTCKGDGVRWLLPTGMSPFTMSIFDIAQHSQPTPCHCLDATAVDALLARALLARSTT